MFEIFWRNWLIIRVAHSFSRLAALFHDELSGDSSGPASPRGLVSCQAIIVSCILALMSNISPHPLRSSYPYICTSIFFDNFTVCVCGCVCACQVAIETSIRHLGCATIPRPAFGSFSPSHSSYFAYMTSDFHLSENICSPNTTSPGWLPSALFTHELQSFCVPQDFPSACASVCECFVKLIE